MEKISIANLRSLVQTGLVPIKPITLLVGVNNSGKSTFLRTLPLLKQSYETIATGPLLWYGKYVDFGNFIDSVNNNRKNEPMQFGYEFRINEQPRVFEFSGKKKYLPVRLTVSLVKTKEDAFCREILLEIFDHRILIVFNVDHSIAKLQVNATEFFHELKDFVWSSSKGLIPSIDYKKSNTTTDFIFTKSDIGILHNLYEDTARSINFETFIKIHSVDILPSTDMMENLKNPNNKSLVGKMLEKSKLGEEDYCLAANYIIADRVFSILEKCNDYLAIYAKNVKYVAPVRATYRYIRSQNLSIDEVDSQGYNLAILLKNMEEDGLISEYGKWAKKFFDFQPLLKNVKGEVYSSIEIKQGDNSWNMADMGFGYSQMLPIITQLWHSVHNPHNKRITGLYPPLTIAIEQPELHLHPQLQARVAKSLVDIMNYASSFHLNVDLILETHSKVFINKIGHLILQKVINADLINIIVFEKSEKENSTTLKFANYDKNGFLQEWPYGFFDPDLTD